MSNQIIKITYFLFEVKEKLANISSCYADRSPQTVFYARRGHIHSESLSQLKFRL